MAKKKKMTRKEKKAAAAARRQQVATAEGSTSIKVEESIKAPVRKATATPRRQARKQPNVVQRILRETKGELQKVSWPTREEAWRLTVVVTVVTLFMAVFLWFFDWLFTRLFALILG